MSWIRRDVFIFLFTHFFFFFPSQKFSFGWRGLRNAQLPFCDWPWQDGPRFIWRRLKCALEQKRITLCHFTARESRAPEVNAVWKSYCRLVCASHRFHSGGMCECVWGRERHMVFARNSNTISPRWGSFLGCSNCSVTYAVWPRSHSHIAQFYLSSVVLPFSLSPTSTIPFSNKHLSLITRNIFIFCR